MTEISFPSREPSLLSPRTTSYVAAHIREGDKFDYSKWLEESRENERRPQQVLAAGRSDELVCRETGNRGDVLERRNVWPTLRPAPITRTAPIPIAIWRFHRNTEDETPEARLTQRLERICDAWNDFQSSRARDAVYGYLASVFAIVQHYKVRRKTRMLMRHAFEFADLLFDRNADPFTAIIRCTSDSDVDGKTISKWARALRYVARSKWPTMLLEKFVKRVGGINACATLYARYFGRGAARLGEVRHAHHTYG